MHGSQPRIEGAAPRAGSSPRARRSTGWATDGVAICSSGMVGSFRSG